MKTHTTASPASRPADVNLPAPNVHPHDIISRCIDKINLLNNHLTAEGEGMSIVMPETLRSGFYFSFFAITEELDSALSKLVRPVPVALADEGVDLSAIQKALCIGFTKLNSYLGQDQNAAIIKLQLDRLNHYLTTRGEK